MFWFLLALAVAALALVKLIDWPRQFVYLWLRGELRHLFHAERHANVSQALLALYGGRSLAFGEAAAPPPRLPAGLSTAPIPSFGGTDAAVVGQQTPEVAAALAGFLAKHIECGYASADQMSTHLTSLFHKHQAPLGLLSKLAVLCAGVDRLEFIVDDSGSMNGTSGGQTRWQEVQLRMALMLELLTAIPAPPIRVRFLNRPTVLAVKIGRGEAQSSYCQKWMAALASEFVNAPQHKDTTPLYETLQQSFSEAAVGQRVARYVFCDGAPNGGSATISALFKWLVPPVGLPDGAHWRSPPQHSPLTFLSCSDNDDEVQWMSDLEEVSPYTAEIDDYETERRAVEAEHGSLLPYTYGVWLISALVAALCPDDLDALDEGVPLTKYAFDQIVGVVSSLPTYRAYWEGAMVCQRRHWFSAKAVEQQKAAIEWEPLYTQFCVQRSAAAIPQVALRRQAVHRMIMQQHQAQRPPAIPYAYGQSFQQYG